MNVTADPNLKFKSRETNITVSNGNLTKSVKINQNQIPFSIIQPLVPNYNYINSRNFVSSSWVTYQIGSDGVLEQVVNSNAIGELSRNNNTGQCFLCFYLILQVQ